MAPVVLPVRASLHYRSFQLSTHKQTCPKRAAQLASSSYKVTIKSSQSEESFQCPGDSYILDAALDNGVELPFECSAGGCSACGGRVVAGELDQSDQRILSEDQVKLGYAMLCTSRPKSDCVIQLQHL